jgi:hypothetical protein
MLFTCYHYHSNRNANCLLFIKDKGIINIYNVYTSPPLHDYNLYDNPNNEFAYLLLVITEEKMKEYPDLYEKYTVSMMLTEDATQLSKDERGYYISKKTIWKNLYITQKYDHDIYLPQYPVMSYKLSNDIDIRDKMYFIEDIVMIEKHLIDEKMISRYINNESKSIDKELNDIENKLKIMKNVSQYINKIMPENFPDDLKNNILAKIYVF